MTPTRPDAPHSALHQDDDATTALDWQLIHRGRFLEVGVARIQLPNGTECELDMLLHPGAAAVVPVDDEGHVTLIRQYRHATGGWLLEIPAGKRDPGESPTDCAHRELTEEVGLAAGTLTPLGPIWTSPGFTNELIHLFLATDLVPADQALDEDEVIEVVRMPLDDALALAGGEAMPDAKSALALLRAAHALKPSA